MNDPTFDAFYTKHSNEKILEAIQQLTERRRIALVCRHIHRMTFKECGKVLGVQKERARQIIANGERRLIKLLKSWISQDGIFQENKRWSSYRYRKIKENYRDPSDYSMKEYQEYRRKIWLERRLDLLKNSFSELKNGSMSHIRFLEIYGHVKNGIGEHSKPTDKEWSWLNIEFMKYYKK